MYSVLEFQSDCLCPYCDAELKGTPLWQGIHVCLQARCSHCDVSLVSDQPVGQSFYTPYTVCLDRKEVFGDETCRGWYGQPLLDSLLSPVDRPVGFLVEKVFDSECVIILNCLDFLYGHSLLKLLNADRHLRDDFEFGLVVIIPKMLRWMVPDGVAEVWTVNLSLAQMRSYYLDLDRQIKKECERFSKIDLSPAYSHPSDFEISRFTRVQRHDFSMEKPRITFIWRDDRLWHPTTIAYRVFRKLGMDAVFVWWQKRKIIRLFKMLKVMFPDMRYTVAGVGAKEVFPTWIEDKRVAPPMKSEQEIALCEVYSESRVVIGVHGSNMLLPSAHAGMVVDLMPEDRWGNMIQDILYSCEDARMAGFLYRYAPLNISMNDLETIVSQQILDHEGFKRRMLPHEKK